MSVVHVYGYKCPSCANKFHHFGTLSSNNIGQIGIWLSGLTSRYNYCTRIGICSNCDWFFWVKDAVEEKSFGYDYQSAKKDYSGTIKHPETIGELNNLLLDKSIVKNEDDEIYIRKALWFMYEDLEIIERKEIAKDGKEPSVKLKECIKLKKHNLESVISLLHNSYDKRPSEILQKAEILRQLARYDESSQVLDTLDTESLRKISLAMRELNHKKDSRPAYFSFKSGNIDWNYYNSVLTY